MRRFKNTLALFLSSLPMVYGKAPAAIDDKQEAAPNKILDPVQLRPLNLPGDNVFAAHRSHSSHASHRSSSGGGYSSPASPTPSYPSPPPPSRSNQPVQPTPSPSRSQPGSSPNYLTDPATQQPGAGRNQPTDPGRAAPVSPAPAPVTPPQLSRQEKLTLQVMRVQIALQTLGLYSGQIDGKLNDDTKEALKRFQVVKGISATGLMTTETLNALAVPAVQ